MMAGIKYWDVLQGYNICLYIPVTSTFLTPKLSLKWLIKWLSHQKKIISRSFLNSGTLIVIISSIQILSPWQGIWYIVDSGIGLSYRPARLHSRFQWFAAKFAESSCFMWGQAQIRPKNENIPKKSFHFNGLYLILMSSF